MKKLIQQQQQKEIKALHSLLVNNRLDEKKDDASWLIIENELISKLEEDAHLEHPSFIQIIKQKYQALGQTLALNFYPVWALSLSILIGLGIYMSTTKLEIKDIASSSKNKQELSTKKNVRYISSSVQNGSDIFSGQIFETTNDMNLVVSLDNGTSFLLSKNSKLTVKKMLDDNIDLFLTKGSFLTSVSPRSNDQRFVLSTPDAICQVIGTIFKVTIEEKKTALSVFEGKVAFSLTDSDEKIIVTSGTSALTDNNYIKQNDIEEHDIPHYLLSLLRFENTSRLKNNTNGVLDITSKPSGATVFINNKKVGITPLIMKYPLGEYTLRISAKGYCHWDRKIVISFNKVLMADAKLKYLSAKFALTKDVNSLQSDSCFTKFHSEKVDNIPTKDFGFIYNPSFVEALMQITVKEYRKAVVILDSLKDLPEVSITERIRIMKKISTCYKEMGNFQSVLKSLSLRYKSTNDHFEKSNLLWEIITVKANCLEDYVGAEKDIITYVNTYSSGPWLEAAYAKLGEIQYITEKYQKSIGTYQYHVNFFKTSKNRDKSMYTVANIMRQDIKDYTLADEWYTKLLDNYPTSKYAGNALFERATCSLKRGKSKAAKKDFDVYLKTYPRGQLRTLCDIHLAQKD